jgi:hypothetical protein
MHLKARRASGPNLESRGYTVACCCVALEAWSDHAQYNIWPARSLEDVGRSVSCISCNWRAWRNCLGRQRRGRGWTWPAMRDPMVMAGAVRMSFSGGADRPLWRWAPGRAGRGGAAQAEGRLSGWLACVSGSFQFLSVPLSGNGGGRDVAGAMATAAALAPPHLQSWRDMREGRLREGEHGADGLNVAAAAAAAVVATLAPPHLQSSV